MSPLALRAYLRFSRRHPGQLALSIVGIALGVALFVGIRLASASVRRSFTLSAETLAGRATHAITAPAPGVPAELYRRLRVELGVRAIAPVVELDVLAADRPGEALRVVGLDPFAEADARPGSLVGRVRDTGGLGRFLTEPRTVLLPAAVAERLGVRAADVLAVRVGAQRVELRVVGVLPASAEAAGAAHLLVADLATAQELRGLAAPHPSPLPATRGEGTGAGPSPRPSHGTERDASTFPLPATRGEGQGEGPLGHLSRIDVVAPAGAEGERLLALLRDHLPPGTSLVAAGARVGALAEMTRAFDLNLAALGLLSLVVGAFLVTNTTTFTVVRRRSALATLRALGGTAPLVRRLVLSEAALIGAIGSIAGLALGALLARGLLGLITRAVTDLYFVVSVSNVTLDPLTLAVGGTLGVMGALLAAYPAAAEAARISPRLAMQRSGQERTARSRLAWLTFAAALCATIAAALLLAPTRSLGIAFAGLFFLVLAPALAAPALLVLASRGLARPLALAFGPLGRLAASDLAAHLSRTGIALAALMTALSVGVGVGVMVVSFRSAVESWLATTLVADVYVTAPNLTASRNEARLPPDLPERFAALPGLSGLSTYLGFTLDGPEGRTFVVGLRLDPRQREALTFLDGDGQAAWRAFDDEEAVFVSEPLAFRRGLHAGSELPLTTGHGPRRFRVAAVFRDYGNEAGTVMMHRRTLDRHFDLAAAGPSSIALFAQPGTTPAALAEAARRAAHPDETLVVRESRTLREASLTVFDRTFEVTRVLRLLAVAVAALGTLGALLALALERERELAVLRALGATAGRVTTLVAGETTLLGAVAGLYAIPVGLLLAAVLVHVINRRSFGWSLALAPTASSLWPVVLVGATAGLAAGLPSAWRAARRAPAVALRDE